MTTKTTQRSMSQAAAAAVLASVLLGFPPAQAPGAEAGQQATLDTGVSSSEAPFMHSNLPGAEIKSILTVGDTMPLTGNSSEAFRLAGILDGMGAFDNGDGTFTLLVNHELRSSLGAVRRHGAAGAFVSRLVIDKATCEVLSGSDLIGQMKSWDGAGFVDTPAPAGEEGIDRRAYNRLCSADLPVVSAFWDPASGRGTQSRILMHGEEAGPLGRAFASVVTGPEAGVSYELPHLGNTSFENVVACPKSQELTIVALLDDSHEGELYFYVGDKGDAGTEAEKAGLVGGHVFGVRIPGKPFETDPGNEILATEPFEMADLGDVSGADGEELNDIGAANGVTRFGRPEDGVWDPRPGRENTFYWVTTGGRSNGRTTPTRLWKMEFADISRPELGGVMTIVLDAALPGPDFTSFDNMTMGRDGVVFVQEDTGGSGRLARIWGYDTTTGNVQEVAFHSPEFFDPAGGDFLTTNEESSGIIPLNDILGDGWYAVTVQAHFSLDSESAERDVELRARFGLTLEQGIEVVEGGQIALINLAGAEQGEVFADTIPAGSTWSYLANGSDPGPEWVDASFDDSGWPVGPAEFGFGDGDEVNDLTGLNADNRSYFFRKRFSVAEATDVLTMELCLKRDDGAIVYINGQEVFRDNLPDGPVSAGTLAPFTARDDGEQFLKVEVPTGVLVDGENVVAVSVHQLVPSSEDLSFDLALTSKMKSPVAGDKPVAPSGLAAASDSPSEVQLTWTDGSSDEGYFVLERRRGDSPWEILSGRLVPGQEAFADQTVSGGMTYDYRVKAVNVFGASALSNVATVTTPAAPADTILAEDFSSGTLGAWRAVSLASTADWEPRGDGDTFYAQGNGFGADEASDDWLVSPVVDFDAFEGEVFTFDTLKGFDGPALEVLMSQDYDGGADPSTATWSPLPATLSAGGFTRTPSGEIDLSGVSGTGYLAFRYVSVGTGGGDGALWQVFDIALRGIAPEGGGVSYPFAVAAPLGDVVTEVDGEKVVRNGGYGSGMAKHPTQDDLFYLLTDRGPNFNGGPGEKLFPTPDFAPQIGVFRLVGGELVKERIIEIRDAVGAPISGLPNPVGFGGTGETPLDLDGSLLNLDPVGLDPEGLVAMPDGTFWISDEYGPHILHIAADGRTIERINPFGLGTGGRRLPKVFANRRANRGMEGLTVTPDGRTLVGIMQSAMYNPSEDRGTIKRNSRATRIVTFDVVTGETQQFVYMQEKPNLSNSEIRAISGTEFVVLERDGAFPTGPGSAIKKFYKIDLTGATDISDPADGLLGKLFDIGGELKTLEQMTDEEIEGVGIVPVEKKLMIDLLAAVPGYPHDKPEGFVLLDDEVLAIINDDDFGILADGNGSFRNKILPLTDSVDRNVLHFVQVAELSVDFSVDLTEVLTTDEVQFSVNASGGIGDLSFEWDFGDGEGSHEMAPAHTFGEGGLFTVRLTVRDADGNEVEIVKADLVAVTEATEQTIPESLADLRVAAFNASLNRGSAGALIADLSTPGNAQAQHIAEIIQLANADVILINEFDYDAAGEAIELFLDNYLEVGQNGLDPVEYPFVFLGESNTGIDSGFDLDNDGTATGTQNDAFGFGSFPGQYGMVLLSKYPIVEDDVRTFQTFLWKDMPGALLPDDPGTAEPMDWYSPAELDVFRLSSKSHWDVPIEVDGRVVHFLASHPTPPVFDGPEDRNGLRNHDEIRFWADYVDPAASGYIYDDTGATGGLADGDLFVILGDQNADPNDGDSTNNAIDQLLGSALINSTFVPRSDGGVENNDGGATQTGDPGEDTSSFHLRVDYVLPSEAGLRVQGGEVFWPVSSDVRFRKVTGSTDHRLVYLDMDFGVVSDFALQILHSSDNESAFQTPNTLEPTILNYASVIDGLRTVVGAEGIPSIYVTAGDHTLPGPFYQAAAEAPSLGAPGLGDIGFFNAMGLTANGMGNHEFDGGIDEFATMLAAADYPFLAVNLDFSGVVLDAGSPAIEIGVDASNIADLAGKVAKSAWVEVGGEKIGLIGRAPADFFNVIEDPATTLPGLDFFGGRDPSTNQPLVSALGQVLEQVDLLKAQGVDKIVLLDHAQDFTGDPLNAESLRDIDVVVSAGSTGFFASDDPIGPFNLLRPGDEASENYPTVQLDTDGNPVLVVNTDQLYRYVGNLIVGFDAAGIIDFIDKRSGPVAATEEAIAAFGGIPGFEGLVLDPSAEVQAIWDALQGTPSIQDLFAVVGTTEFPLNGARADVRTRETNLGRLAADSTLWFAQDFLDDNSINLDVDIALKNGGGIRSTIEGPNITRLTIGAALAFDNQLSIIELTAAELLAAMENAVSRFPARDGRFPQLAGVSLEFDATRPGISDEVRLVEPSRIGSLVVTRANGVDDVVVDGFQLVGDPERTFVLATNSFLLTGGDGYAAFAAIDDDPARQVFATTLGEQDILEAYIVEELGGTVELDDRNLSDPRVSVFSSGKLAGSYSEGSFDEGGAEIVDYCPLTRRLFVTNSNTGMIDVLDASDPDNIQLVHAIPTEGGAPNSLAVRNGIVAVAVENDNKQLPGWVVFYDTYLGVELNRIEAGALPDMLTFTPDGRRVVVANEGEPDDDYVIDPHGSVTVIDIGDLNVLRIVTLTQDDVRQLGFEALGSLPFLADILRGIGIRIFGKINDPETGEYLRDSTVPEDLEPEYIAVSPDSATAYVACQENNALAIFDLDSGDLLDLVPLGYKDHSLEGNGFDASNRDDGIDIRPHPALGMYMPDSIEAFEALGQTFIISANEGDSRDYDGFSEEVRVDDLVLDPVAYPNAAELQDNANLGRLKTTTETGDTDGDGDIDQIYSYGARSFSIWDAAGNLVFDSGDQLERILADRLPDNFNASNDDNDLDDRSDDKGPEPEGVTVGEIDGRLYAFLGLERVGGFMIFDITYPYSPVFVDYVNNRNFDADPEDELELAGDLGPEGLRFIPGELSPTGNPALVVANEVSGTTTMFDIQVPPTAGFQLQVLHSSDNESAFQDPNTGEEKILHYAAVVEGLRSLAFRERMHTLHLTAGDHTLPGPFYQASADVDEFGAPGLADIAFYNAMGLTANGMGNHEFDGGIDEFATMLATANYPFLAANLDFSGVLLADGTPAIEIGEDASNVIDLAGKVAKSAWVEVGGEKIGLIGRAPADFFNVIENPAATLPGLDFVGGRDPSTNQPLVSALGQVLEQVDLLESKGVNKIILLDHAQDFTGDPLSASTLRGIDIIVAAGSTGFMARDEAEGPFNRLRDGDSPEAAYPTVRTDSDGETVLVVNSDQLFSYVGQLIVGFDREGHIRSIDPRSGPVAATEESVALLGAEVGQVLSPPAEVERVWELLRGTEAIEQLFEVVGTTTAELVGLRAEVRSRETNLGRLAADSTLWFAQQFVDDESIPVAVDVALKNGGGIRSTIAGPNITRLTIGAALAFDNKLAIVEVTGAELLAIAENAVSRYPALDGRFPQVAGMRIEFDPGEPGVSDAVSLTVPSRVRTLVVTRADGSEDVVVENGVPLGDLNRLFGLATNSFLLTGGDGYQALAAVDAAPGRAVFGTLLGEQQILEDYIAGPLGGSVDLPEPLAEERVSIFTSPLLARYEDWAGQFVNVDDPGTGLLEDFDGDGNPNRISYVFGIDLRRSVTGSSNLPSLHAGDGSPDVFLSYELIDDPDVALTWRKSADLVDWTVLRPGVDYEIVERVPRADTGTVSCVIRVIGAGNLGSQYFQYSVD